MAKTTRHSAVVESEPEAADPEAQPGRRHVDLEAVARDRRMCRAAYWELKRLGILEGEENFGMKRGG